MSNRRIIVLMLLGIVILACLEFLLAHRGTKLSPRRDSLVEVESPIVEIAIIHKETPPVRLRYESNWQIVAPYHGNVHVPAVLRLIDALTLSSVTERYTDADLEKIGRERADFSLVDPHLKVELKLADGTAATVAFGVPTPTADGVYAAVAEVPAVFIVPTGVFEAADVTAEGLRLRELMEFNPKLVAEFSIRRGNNPPVVFVQDEKGWQCGKCPASTTKLREYLESLSAAQAQTFVWPVGATNEPERAAESLLSGYGLDAENAITVTVKGGDGSERRLALGKEASTDSVYALVQGGTAVVTVPASILQATAQDPARFTDLRLFPVEAASVSAFTLVEAETAYTLVRGGNDRWQLEAPIVAEADSAEVVAMLERITKLTASDADPHGVSISLSSNSSPVKVAAAAVLPRAGLRALRSRKVLNVEPEAIKRIVCTARDQTPTAVVYSRERKVWNVEKPEGRGTADESAIAKVIAALTELKAEEIVKLKVPASDLDDYGLDTPYLTIAVDQDKEGAVRRNLLLGDKVGKGRYATVGSTDAVFVIAADQARRLALPLVKGL